MAQIRRPVNMQLGVWLFNQRFDYVLTIIKSRAVIIFHLLGEVFAHDTSINQTIYVDIARGFQLTNFSYIIG